MDDGPSKPRLPEVVPTGDGSRTLRHPVAGDTYGSHHGAATEARHVFLSGSGVHERLAAGRPTRILEVGLGTGLNLTTTWAHARAHGAPLTYVALEREPISPAALAALRPESWGEDPRVASAWRAVAAEAYRAAAAGSEGLWRPGPGFGLAVAGLDLTVALGDAVAPDGTGPSELARRALALGPFDAVYHDAFRPEANPGPWTPAFLAACAGALVPGGRWVSYSVAGAVRRALAEAGLTVAKRPGPPGGKREMLVATRPGDDAPPP